MSNTAPEQDRPAHDELADEDDQLGWNIAEHGRMRAHAAPDDAVPVSRAPVAAAEQADD